MIHLSRKHDKHGKVLRELYADDIESRYISISVLTVEGDSTMYRYT